MAPFDEEELNVEWNSGVWFNVFFWKMVVDVHDGCFFIHKHEHIFTNITNLQQ